MAFPRPSSPIELPGGRLACGIHGLVICPRCCVDYSFIDEDLPTEDNTSSSSRDEKECTGPERTTPNVVLLPIIEPQLSPSGTGRSFEKFIPPDSAESPLSLFPPRMNTNMNPPDRRLINRTDPTEMLIHTDGACLNNGHSNSTAGCAFVFKPALAGHINFRLENKGTTGEVHQQTSNRAELRAVIGALMYRNWKDEGFSNLVIATDSEYVVEGATNWIRGWIRRGWTTRVGAPVKNRDLWHTLFDEAERWSHRGLTISFWRIPREMNTAADGCARLAATWPEVDRFTAHRDVNVCQRPCS
ncbi:hypothetical protein PHISCL_09738 [Aspergillus sclerotialis]|uniref:ribonuclease H n=1 Tax=Aspergillus sclerotialis TaxID=2070753 RepID=A0A3A2Z9G8_9EURO|nr:hypothetical protein PHISCL_09738 [Aspergillus sclerotialis]